MTVLITELTAEPSVDTDPAASGVAAEPRWSTRVGARFGGLIHTPVVWLVPILGLQAALAVRINGPVATDEATYIVAGHQLIDHLFGGARAQDYGAYFSGVPSLYPVLAAMIDRVLGLTGIRLLSLLCMLVVNGCLFSVARRLFGVRSATAASLIFAISSGATFMAWYSTFDALSLMLLAVATMLSFEVAEGSALWRCAVIGPILVLAVAVKYVALMYVPAVLVILAVASIQRHRWRAALPTISLAAATTLLSALLAWLLVSSADLAGFFATSSSGRRVLGAESKWHLIRLSWNYVGPSLLLALAGLATLLALRQQRVIGLLLFGTGLLPVISQVILGEATSLHKHTAFGLFFAAPLAGLAISRALAFGRIHAALAPVQPISPAESKVLLGWLVHFPARSARRALVPVIALAWVTILLGTGMASASTMRYGWPESAQVATELSPLVSSSGHYLADNASIPSYLFRDRTSPDQWTAPWFFERTSEHQTLKGDAALLDAVEHGYFDVIVYRPQTFTAAQALVLLPAIAHRYQLVAQLPYGHGQFWFIWVPLA